MAFARAGLVALLLVFALLPGLMAAAQTAGQTGGLADVHGARAGRSVPDLDLGHMEPYIRDVEARINAPSTEIDDLESMRELLLSLRTTASRIKKSALADLEQASDRLAELGEPPPESVDEPEELQQGRRKLASDLAAAKLPVLQAEEIILKINGLLSELEKEVWNRLSSELLHLGPSPLLPGVWVTALATLQRDVRQGLNMAGAFLSDPDNRADIRALLPQRIAILVLGIVIAFTLSRWLSNRIDEFLNNATTPRRVTWLLLARNAVRLIFPAVGAGLLLAAIAPETLSGAVSRTSIFLLPKFVLALIAAGWLANSLYSTSLDGFRVIPLGEKQARQSGRLVRWLGLALAAHYLFRWIAGKWEPEAELIAAAYFVLIVVSAVLLWRAARMMRSVRHNLERIEASMPPDQHVSAIGKRVLGVLDLVLRLVALTAPVLAAIGYIAGASFLMFSSIMTLGLWGAGLVVFDLFQKTSQSVDHRTGLRTQEGLWPVLIIVLLVLFNLPILALIWGARPADITSVWIGLRDGFTVGGFTISLVNIFKFIFVFALVYGLTRFVRAVLKSSVLPRTNLDMGGKNAVLAGVRYTGFTLAALAAVSSTGADLSSLAIVAGALSVGIGFGLQTIVSNFVSGIILLIERPIKEGDWIEVGGFAGYVRDISVRSTSIETFDRASVILPNSDLVAGTVLNRTHTGMSGRLEVPVGVAYDSDPREVERVLLDIAESHPLVLEDPAPRVVFMGFGDSSMDFEVRCWLRDVNFSLSAKSDMNFDIFERFQQAGITIPFPQRDVNITGLESLAAGSGTKSEVPEQS